MIEFVLFQLETGNIYRALGLLGFGFYALMYVLLTWRYVDGDSVIYFAGNTVGAALTLCSVLADYNLTTVLISVFWILIGVKAIYMRRRRGAGLIAAQ